MNDAPRSHLDWTDHRGRWWTAIGPTGTHWEIRDFAADGSMRFGIIVAHWDHPDWWAATLEEAQDLAAEFDARPPVPESECVEDRPYVHVAEGEDTTVPFETTLSPPDSPCPSCASRARAAAVKPRRHTLEWWDDPCRTGGALPGLRDRARRPR